jgi:uncharacterized protein YcbX
MVLSGLFIYPVKSLRGFAVPSAEIDALGLAGDRRFLVVDENNGHVTQRQLPRMARISAALSAETLTLSAEGASPLRVPRRERNAPLRTVSIWKSHGLLAEDCGDEAAKWLGDFLEAKCRLVRIGEKFHRPVLKAAAQPGDLFHCGDAAPFLVLSEASVANLNDRIVARGGSPVPMDRFRPNLVVSDCDAFEEDTWTRFRIGDVVFRTAGNSTRCVVTTTDQLTGERGKEPLLTLAAYRRNAKDSTDVDFGQNVIHETKTGSVRVGDAVEVLS